VLIKERNSLRAQIQTLESSAVSTVAVDTDVCESSVNLAFAIFGLLNTCRAAIGNKYLLLTSLRCRPLKTQSLAKDHESLCQKLDGLYQAAAEKDGRIAEVRPKGIAVSCFVETGILDPINIYRCALVCKRCCNRIANQRSYLSYFS
jgi:hypothetical protein